MRFGYIGSMTAKPRHRDDVVAILTSGAEGLRAAGCDMYAVSVAADDDVSIWVHEVRQSKQHHRDSLQLPEVKAAIATAIPMLTGEFITHEVAVVGGRGV